MLPWKCCGLLNVRRKVEKSGYEANIPGKCFLLPARSWKKCRRRRSPPGNGHTRVLLPGTSHSGIRSSLPLGPPQKAGSVASPTSRLAWADGELPRSAVNGVFSSATKADYSPCFRRGVKPAENHWLFTPLLYRRTARDSRKWKKRIQCSMHVLHYSGATHRR